MLCCSDSGFVICLWSSVGQLVALWVLDQAALLQGCAHTGAAVPSNRSALVLWFREPQVQVRAKAAFALLLLSWDVIQAPPNTGEAGGELVITH